MNNFDRFKTREIIDQFKNKKIAVIGDLMLDHYVFGRVEKISPEAPAPVVLFEEEKFFLGGAANVANNIKALGGEVFLVGAIGEDEAGKTLKRKLEEKNMNIEGLFRVSDRPTIQKTRIIAQGQQLSRIDREKTFDVSMEIENKVTDFISNNLRFWDIVVLSDYAKGFMTKNIVSVAINLARGVGKKVIVDTKQRQVDHFKNATLLTPNEKEAFEMTGVSDVMSAGKALQAKLSSNILITQGAKGMTLFEGGESYFMPAIFREVFDVTGAGDTVLAVLALSLASGLDLISAANLSNLAGGIVVGKKGTAVVSSVELKKAAEEI